jgi:hypothetical protein
MAFNVVVAVGNSNQWRHLMAEMDKDSGSGGDWQRCQHNGSNNSILIIQSCEYKFALIYDWQTKQKILRSPKKRDSPLNPGRWECVRLVPKH